MHQQSIPHPSPGSNWIRNYIHQTTLTFNLSAPAREGCFNLEKLIKVKYLQRVSNSIAASVGTFDEVLKQINTTVYLGSNRATKLRLGT